MLLAAGTVYVEPEPEPPTPKVREPSKQTRCLYTTATSGSTPHSCGESVSPHLPCVLLIQCPPSDLPIPETKSRRPFRCSNTASAVRTCYSALYCALLHCDDAPFLCWIMSHQLRVPCSAKPWQTPDSPVNPNTASALCTCSSTVLCRSVTIVIVIVIDFIFFRSPRRRRKSQSRSRSRRPLGPVFPSFFCDFQ